MFEFAPLGIIFFTVGTIYMLTVGVRLIPERRGEGDLTETFALNEYVTEIVLLPDAPSVGHKIKNAPLVKDLEIAILEIRRGDEVIHQPNGEVVLLGDDVLRVRCDLEKIRVLQDREGVALKPQAKWGDESLTNEDYKLIEAVISPNSFLIGKTLQQIAFRERFRATVLAIRHHGQLLREKISDTPLKAGDVLLIEARKDRLNRLRQTNEFFIISEMETSEFRRNKIILALLIVAGVVLSASLGLAPIVVSAVVGAILLILVGCLTLEEAYDSIVARRCAGKIRRGGDYFLADRFIGRRVRFGRARVGVLSFNVAFDRNDVEQRDRRPARADCHCDRRRARCQSAAVSDGDNLCRFVEFSNAGRLSNKHDDLRSRAI
jgi:Trk K+ transport system NAD-binding subunit